MNVVKCGMNCLGVMALMVLTMIAKGAAAEEKNAPQTVTPNVRVLDLKPVWSGHPTRFALLTEKGRQFVAFYDANRQMTLAQRNVDDDVWTFKALDTFIVWDSHNAVTIALDRQGILHVSGNMHCVPLIYFKGSKPFDIQSVERVAGMTGEREKQVTYPVFLKGINGELIFNYRDGKSGNGATFYNVYDEENQSWKRLIEGPIFDGLGKMNAYPQAPKKGPDGWFHMTWVWRNTPMAETNHDLSYARSRDLIHWEAGDGQPLKLPITLQSPGAIVDPIPVKGGIINGSGKAGFDLQGNVVIAYHKFDEKGNTQLYFARLEKGKWKSYLATKWDYRWDFSGPGTLAGGISHSFLEPENGKLKISLSHLKYGGGTFEVNPETFELMGKVDSNAHAALPAKLGKVVSTFPEMKVNWMTDAGDVSPNVEYRVRWETLGPNRDLARPKPWPEPTMLQVVEIRR